MKFFKVFAFLFVITTILSCLDLRNCNKSSVGKYICENNPKAENYLVLNSNGTFTHYYKEGEVELIDNGTWEKSKDGNCIIELSNWKTFNESGLNYSELANGLLWISYEYLDIGPDGENSNSFKKLNEDTIPISL